MKSLLMVLACLFSVVLSQKTEAKIKLALNWKPEPQFGGFYAAEINGEFKKKNLDVEILQGGSGTPTVQMLANDKIEYAIVGGEEILLSLDRNPQNKIIPLFASFQDYPAIIMSHKERNFKNLQDVFASEGVLALQLGLPYYNFLLKKYGKNQKVKIVPYLGGITNFLQDKNFSQQGFITSEPLSAEKAGAKVSTFLISEEGFNPYTTVLAVNAAYAKKHPQEVLAITEAVRAGWRAYLKDPQPVNKYMSGLNKSMSLETFAASAQAQEKLIETPETKARGLGWMSESRWQELSRQLKELGLIKKAVAVDLTLQNK